MTLPLEKTPGTNFLSASQLQSQGQIALVWFLGAMLIVALAGPFPQATTLLLVIILFMVLVTRWDSIVNYIPGSSKQ